jgi:hypothetical protein
MLRIVAAILLAGCLGWLVAGCGGDDGPTAEEQALLDDERFGPETLESANYGGEIEADEGRLLLYPSESGLSLLYDDGDDRESLDNVDVDEGSVIGFRDYRVRVTSISDSGMTVQVAKLDG